MKTHKGMIDTHFARTLLLLAGALVIFAFWFMYESDKPLPEAPIVNVKSNKMMDKNDNKMMKDGEAMMDQDATDNVATEADAADPVLSDIGAEDLAEETLTDLDDLDELFDEDDLGDLDF